jgi:endonuclease/exonuclease/phosphatase family metal-dependent hydrolase
VPSPPRRRELINRGLRELKPDLVALQEVKDAAHLEALLEATELHGTKLPTIIAGDLNAAPDASSTWHAHAGAHCHVIAARLAFDRPTDGIWPSDH